MTPEEWQRVRPILESALELDPASRPGFLDEVCADPSLRREVESLIAADEQGRSGFLQSPPVMRLVKGTRIGDYEIQSMLGAGGMGEVYRGRDLRLRRDVAIKVLPAFVSSDPDRLRRFELEAAAAAALNHPNILAVHQLGTSEGAPYLVSELLEGETLRDRLNRGRVPARKAVDYGVQIARGLAAAHEKGIAHRDLKPENLFVTKDGRMKILDFGLAKLAGSQSAADHGALGSSDETAAGVVMGTVGYMSPEQVRGQTADRRADIFALGAILFEMLTGKRAFQKASSAETMAAIVNDEVPNISELTPEVPPGLQLVVHHCLEKNPDHRFQSMSDLAFALEALSDQAVAAQNPMAALGTRLRERRPWGLRIKFRLVFAAGLVLLFFFSYWLLTDWWQPPRVLSYTQLTQFIGTNVDSPSAAAWWDASLATDGSRLYFSRLMEDHYVLAQTSVEGGEAIPLVAPFRNTHLLDIDSTGSELLVASSSGLEGERPFWALPLPGGSPRRLADVVGHAGSWSPGRAQLVYATGSDLYVAGGDGTHSQRLATVAGDPRWLRWSPKGTLIRFTVDDPRSHSSSLWEIKRDGTGLRPLLTAWKNHSEACCGTWTLDGRYFVFQSNHDAKAEIWALSEPLSIFGRIDGQPVQLAAGPMNLQSVVPSRDGKRLFAIGTLARGELVRYDSSSRQFLPFLSGASFEHLAFSKDSEWVTYITYPGAELWRSRVNGSERRQLTFAPMQAGSPIWSPDGKRIAFFGRVPGKPWKIYSIPSDGGSAQQLTTGDRDEADPSWSPDGGTIVFDNLEAPFTIHLLDLRTRQLSTVPDSEGLWSPLWSPDGRFIGGKRNGPKNLSFSMLPHKNGNRSLG